MKEYKRVRVLSCDHLNLARGKYVPPDIAREGLLRQCLGIYAVGYDRALIAAPGSGMDTGLPDLEAAFDYAEIRDSWEQDTGVVVADLRMHNEPLPLCGRSALKSAVQKWRERGLEPFLGIELEGYVFQRDSDGNWVPYDTPGAYVYGTGAINDPQGLMDDIWSTADRLGFPVEAINSEFDWPQFEFTLKYDHALAAIDNAFLFKLMTRELLAKRGYMFSYMPKPLLDRGGSGLHFNISMNDEQGNNAINDADSDGGISDLARNMIAGLIRHHRSLAALMCPTVNSYRRLRPDNICGQLGTWGFDHRNATIRVPPERGRGARIEHRLADCAANPYVAAAAALHAAHLGVSKDYDLPKPEASEDFVGSDSENVVAETLGGALADLEADKVLCNALGPALVDHFVVIKRREWNDFLDHTTDWELERYMEFI